MVVFVMSRRRRRQQHETSYGRLIVWTVVLALVFSAGLITGQRLISQEKSKPFVSISATRDAKTANPKKGQDKKVEFSFYDKLAPGKTPGAKLQNSLGNVVNGALNDKSNNALPARYTLQAGAHSSKNKAKRQMEKLVQKGLEPHLTAINVPSKGKMYKVRVGKFHSLDEARHFQAELQQSRGFKTFVTPL